MAIEVLSSDEALAARRFNQSYSWPNRESPIANLYPIATYMQKSNLRICLTDKIFCIGSCFAREVEVSFKRLGFNVLSKIENLPKFAGRQVADPGFANKYTIGSILTELKNCLDEPQDFHAGFIKYGEQYVDCTLCGINYADDYKNLCALREAFSQQFERIKEADVIVITLGLSEVWYDKFTKTFLNVAPPLRAMKSEPDRFELHVLDFKETVDMLQNSIDVIFEALGGNVKVLLTVSPVPLLTTFRESDVFLANSYSKSVLRTAVEHVVKKNGIVSYFPSYEIATLSNPLCVWGDKDYRHVDSSFVDHITSTAVMSLLDIEDSGIYDFNILARSKSLYRAGFFQEAKEVFHLEYGLDPSQYKLKDSILRMAMIYRRLKDWGSSLVFYNYYLSIEPLDKRAIEGKAIVEAKLVPSRHM